MSREKGGKKKTKFKEAIHSLPKGSLLTGLKSFTKAPVNWSLTLQFVWHMQCELICELVTM